MTLIAGMVTANNLPMLFGDIVVSAPGGREVQVPTIGHRLPNATDDGYQPAGLVQKVVLIASNCALAWAGSLVSARFTVRQLRHLSRIGQLTFANIEAHFREHSADLQDLRVIGFLTELVGEHARHHPFCWGVEKKVIPGADIWISGTGANHFEADESGEWQGLVESTIRGMLQSLSPERKAEGGIVALQLQGALLGIEMTSGATLDHLYGGGYEVAAQVGEGVYSKFQDAVYAYALCDIQHPSQNESVRIEAPFRLSRLRYGSGRELAIYNMDNPFQEDSRLECYVVPDIEDLQVIPQQPAETSARLFANSLCTCLNLICRVNGEVVAVVPILSWGPIEQRPVAIASDELGRVTFRADETWMKTQILPFLLELPHKVALRKSCGLGTA
jgi:hypothetical protein